MRALVKATSTYSIVGRGFSRPTGYNSTGDQTRLDGSSSRVERFRGLDLIVVAFKCPCGQDHEQGKNNAQADQDAISIALAQGW